MGTVSQYKMSNFQSALGGSNPVSLSEYYRGVTYVPTTGPNEFQRQPATGEYYVRTDPVNEPITGGNRLGFLTTLSDGVIGNMAACLRM
jgi:hypothetical protein